MWLVFPEVFRNDFCSGLDHKRVAETLFEHGMLERSKERWEKLQRIKEPGGDVKPKWFYWITDKILESDEGEISPTASPKRQDPPKPNSGSDKRPPPVAPKDRKGLEI